MRYRIFVRILDSIRGEAPQAQGKRYRPDTEDIEKLNQARARAFIHLFLKVMFGQGDFVERERTITDAAGDGGVDGYYIDNDARTVYLIQSKFRINQKNFESKEIDLEELLAMDIDRILGGEKADESGVPYNGKIFQLQRELSEVMDIARYRYKVVILANLSGVTPQKLRQLTGGYPAEVFDAEQTYRRLVFPVLAGTYFAASDIVIPVDLSTKNAGSKISYNVRTRYGDCEITVLFVPTLEIAKIMSKYKNAILKHNPRSYLDLDGRSVNDAIRTTITANETNEFALFNNGIAMLSEETNINEKIGQKNKAQLRIKNPQIINGGQTSYTLSRLYDDNRERAVELFGEKEVLLKVITLLADVGDHVKVRLIEEISAATNKQTPVINADRFANDAFHLEVQQRVFHRRGLIYERKRGEFSDGVRDGYVSQADIMERNHLWRLLYAVKGKLGKAVQKRLFQKNDFSDVLPIEDEVIDQVAMAARVFSVVVGRARHEKVGRDVYAKVLVYLKLFGHADRSVSDETLAMNLTVAEQRWLEFIERQRNTRGPWQKLRIDKHSGEMKTSFRRLKYIDSRQFEGDLEAYLGSL